MKYFFLILLCFPAIAQNPPNTEIFLFEINRSSGLFEVENGKNISQNSGYDNQPAFFSDNLLIYSKTRKGQTDIVGYEPNTGKETWFSNTTQGSEYSPKRIPGTVRIAAVRLDTSGLQRLYQYEQESKENEILVPDLKVGYFIFLNEHRLLTTVLTGTGMDLYHNDLQERISQKLVLNVGRSLQNIPGTQSISYTIVNEENGYDLYLMEFKEEGPVSYFINTLPAGVQDYVWLDRDRILLGDGEKLYIYNTLGQSEWTEVADLSNYNLRNISRIAVSEDGSKMALAAEPATVLED